MKDSMITTVQCSICSQLNNKHRVVVTDFRLHHTCSIIILWLHSLSGVIRSLLCNRILITNAKKVWGTLRSTTLAALLKAIERFASPKSLVKYLSVKRKYKLSRDGQVKKWWFVVWADVSNINLLEQEWLNISIHTGWSLENLYRYEDSIPSNVLPDLPDQQLEQPEGPQKIPTTQVHNTSTLSPTSPTGTETVTHSEVITKNVTNVTMPISNSILSGSQQQQLENASFF